VKMGSVIVIKVILVRAALIRFSTVFLVNLIQRHMFAIAMKDVLVLFANT
jgi:hypothetical protein